MESNLDILLIGGSSFLGKKLNRILSDAGFQASSTYFKNWLPKGFRLDITNPLEIRKMLEKTKPKVVCLLAGCPNVDWCQSHKEMCWQLNVETVRTTVECCKEAGSKLIFLSSNYVFKGDNPPYKKSDIRDPLSFYGATKMVSENIIENNLEDYLILRPDIFYGYNDPDDKESYPSFVIKKLRERNPVLADTVRKRYPTLIDDIANLIRELIDKEKIGIIHATGPNALSRYEWARKIAKVFELDCSLIKPQIERVSIKPLDPGLVLDEEVKFHSVEEGLRIMNEQMKVEHTLQKYPKQQN